MSDFIEMLLKEVEQLYFLGMSYNAALEFVKRKYGIRLSAEED